MIKKKLSGLFQSLTMCIGQYLQITHLSSRMNHYVCSSVS